MESEVIKFLKYYKEEEGFQNAFAKMGIHDFDKQLQIIRIARDSGLVEIKPHGTIINITEKGRSVLNEG